MTREELTAQVTRAVVAALAARRPEEGAEIPCSRPPLPDLTDPAFKAQVLVEDPNDLEALARMKAKTPARIAVGNAGPRLKTQTYLTLRAEHAGARDAVFREVPEELLKQLNLFSVTTLCKERSEHLTRPDLGRRFSQETLDTLRARCTRSPQVQVYVSDGLSGQAVVANVPDLLPVLMDGLRDFGLTVGTPFFVRFGRVPAMDVISETLDAQVTCVLIGERPGLATANSLSAYISYRATVGMPESRRTVVSNIHDGGIPVVEAGAHIARLIHTIYTKRASGVELQQ